MVAMSLSNDVNLSLNTSFNPVSTSEEGNKLFTSIISCFNKILDVLVLIEFWCKTSALTKLDIACVLVIKLVFKL